MFLFIGFFSRAIMVELKDNRKFAKTVIEMLVKTANTKNRY